MNDERPKITECWTVRRAYGEEPSWVEAVGCKEPGAEDRPAILMWREDYDAMLRELEELRAKRGMVANALQRQGMAAKHKTFTLDDIRSWRPCYDPNKHLPEEWNGTAIDILKHDTIPPQDKLWVVCREELIDAKTLRLFAVWCARQVEHLMTDERSKNAIDVAEKFARGEATSEELAAARDAAWDAAWNAARDAAWNAARDAARDAAWNAAGEAAWNAAGDAARVTQISKLIEMLEAHDDEEAK